MEDSKFWSVSPLSRWRGNRWRPKDIRQETELKYLKLQLLVDICFCLVSDTSFTWWLPAPVDKAGLICLFGHGGGPLTAWPIRNSPGTFWPASLGTTPTLSRACQVLGMWIWACLRPSSCSLACVAIRLKQTRANNISESLDVLKLMPPADFCYPTQWILLSLKNKVPWAATGLMCCADGWYWLWESPRRKWCPSASKRS